MLRSAKWEEKVQNDVVKCVCPPPNSAEDPTTLEKTSVVCHTLNNEDNVVSIITFYYKDNGVTAFIKR
jgi:hypothetical protein